MLYDDYARYTQEYKEKYGDQTLVLMEVGSFWELYNCDRNLGANMQQVCGILNITLSRKNKNILEISANNPMMAGFPSHALGKFLPLLVDNDYTVVLIGQVTPPPTPKRDVIGVYSKATYIGDAASAASAASAKCLMCLVIDECCNPLTKVRETRVGIAVIDNETGNTSIAEFGGLYLDDDIFKAYSRYRPAELLIYRTSNTFEQAVLGKTLAVASPSSVRNYAAIASDDMIHKLEYQTFLLKKAYPCQGNSILSIHEELHIERLLYGTSALTAALRYVIDHDPSLVRHLKPPVLSELTQDETHMDLYYNSAEQLELAQLIKMINKCVTPIGKRYFAQRLLNPFCQVDDIQKALDQTEYYEKENKFAAVRIILDEVCDIQKLFRRICVNKAHPHELVSLANSIGQVMRLDDCTATIRKACQTMTDFLQSRLMLDVCAQTSLDALKPEMFIAGVDSKFDSMCEKRDSILGKFTQEVDRLNAIASGTSIFKLEYSERDGVYVSVTTKRYDAIKSKLGANYYRVGGTTTHTKLMSDEMKQACVVLSELDGGLEKQGRERYFKLLEEFVILFEQDFVEIVDCVALSDFYSTSALIAKRYGYTKPRIMTGSTAGCVDAKAMRHPIVELLDNRDHAYVENDIDMRNTNAWLLYGLNAAGKSTLMKMVGLNIIMAQSGLYVPCASMDLWPYHSVFTRISKGDNLMAGQSTFMVEMSELRNILAKADESSLVIGDELCAGTETLSAISIVYCGIQHLLKKKASFIFATHLHELVDHVSQNVRICHLHVEFDRVDMKLRYDRILRDGDGPKTYGVEVCKSLGMPSDFVNDAISMRQTLETGRMASIPKVSQYNPEFLYDERCELCKKLCVGSSEVHHIKHQAEHNTAYQQYKMNMKSNLIVLCADCHDKVHSKMIDCNPKVLTSDTKSIKTLAKEDVASGQHNETLDNLVKRLRYNDHISISKISDKVYKEIGIKLNAYKINKILRVDVKN